MIACHPQVHPGTGQPGLCQSLADHLSEEINWINNRFGQRGKAQLCVVWEAKSFGLSLQAFTVQRAELLTLLKPLKPEIWLRSTIIRGAGKPFERSVLSYVGWMAEHERPHLKQIKRITSTMQK